MYFVGKKGKNGFGYRTTAEEVTKDVDVSGLTAIVTGASNGIGEETARVLALRGATVYIGGWSEESTTKVKEGILKRLPTAKLETLVINLSSQASIREAAEKFLALNVPLNLLINNGGVMHTPFDLTEEDIEIQFGTNYIGHFLLTDLLLEKLKETANESGIESRIVNLSSNAVRWVPKGGIQWDKLNEKKGYDSLAAYGQSKLAMAYHAQKLTRRFQCVERIEELMEDWHADYALFKSPQEEGATNVTINAAHPGVIRTNLWRHSNSIMGGVRAMSFPLWKSVPQGAATTCYVATNPVLKGVSGKFFCDCDEYDITKFNPLGNDEAQAKKLWDVSVEFTSR